MIEQPDALPLTRIERMALRSQAGFDGSLRVPVASALFTGVVLLVTLLLPSKDNTGLRQVFALGFAVSATATMFAVERVGLIRLINRLGGAKAIRSLQKTV